ncbi:UNVERIFIED_CONTAM: hypothetical protein FKN15_065166 [Acipenser sinensis]
MIMILPPGYGEHGFEGDHPSVMRRKSVNTTECVEVPTSEHVAEIVGRQGCKIKALRAKTNTYIKTPVRGDEPVFVVTGRKEDVAMAKREILSAAEHFSMIRASRNKTGPLTGGLPGAPNLPGQNTIQVRVPYRVVGLVVGPKGATIKRIQQQTHTYIVTPSRDKEPVFEVTGMPENVDRAREEIEAHIAMRTGSYVEMTGEENDFHFNGTDVGFEGGPGGGGGAWLNNRAPSGGGPSGTRMISNYRNDSSSSLGSGSTDSYFGGSRMADFSPTSPFNAGSSFWFGDSLLPQGSEDLGGVESPGFDSLTAPPPPPQQQVIWSPFEHGNPLLGFEGKNQRRDSQPSTPRLSPTFSDSQEHHRMYIQAFSSSSESSTSSSPPDSAGPSGTRMISNYRNDSSSSLGSGSTDSYFGGSRMADFSPTSPFNTGSSFWFGEQAAASAPPPPPQQQVIWSPFEHGNPLLGFEGKNQRRDSQPSTPRLSPTFSDSQEHHRMYIQAFSSSSESSTSSSPPDSASSAGLCQGKRDCIRCFESEVIAALVPCGHNLFCMECANRICENREPLCPVCQAPVTQAIRVLSM